MSVSKQPRRFHQCGNRDERRFLVTSYNVDKNNTINRTGCFFFIRGLKLPAFFAPIFCFSLNTRKWAHWQGVALAEATIVGLFPPTVFILLQVVQKCIHNTTQYTSILKEQMINVKNERRSSWFFFPNSPSQKPTTLQSLFLECHSTTAGV